MVTGHLEKFLEKKIGEVGLGTSTVAGCYLAHTCE